MKNNKTLYMSYAYCFGYINIIQLFVILLYIGESIKPFVNNLIISIPVKFYLIKRVRICSVYDKILLIL